jgi:multimeric flavodoxin WrbA
MTVLIHDQKNFDKEIALKKIKNDTTVVSDNGTIKPCICCYSCWIKTPGKCVIADGYDNMGSLLAQCNHLMIISRCFYGGYSPFVQNALNRSVPYLLPYFETKNGETHHRNWYGNTIALTVYFYGEITEKEKATAKKLVRANGENFSTTKVETFFYSTINDLWEALK